MLKNIFSINMYLKIQKSDFKLTNYWRNNGNDHARWITPYISILWNGISFYWRHTIAKNILFVLSRCLWFWDFWSHNSIVCKWMLLIFFFVQFRKINSNRWNRRKFLFVCFIHKISQCENSVNPSKNLWDSINKRCL